MVPLPEVIASNKRIASTLPHGLVAVFVGGTSGVGEYTVKAFAKYAPGPRVYIVGRSQEAANRIIEECKRFSLGGQFEFIKADVSLLKGVDDVCRQIKSKETSINILFETQGTMAFDKTTSEGLPLAAGIIMHSRMRFILNLLPLLQNAGSLRRVVSVLAATCEGDIYLDNIPGKGFPLLKWRNQVSSVQTLLLEEAARRAPDVSFVHTIPGFVKGGIMRDEPEGFRSPLMKAISRHIIEPLLQTLPAECGERHLFLATSAMYAPGRGGTALAGVPLDPKMVPARGIDGQTGSGMYSVDNKGKSAPPKVEKLLVKFREDGTAAKVWDYVSSDFMKITGTEVAP
ncbi:putative short-chain dehydrogenases/reductase [Lipomyces kononenkoae]|uniref:Short-chain dehydrogenases/reductase n=1 Tax=Lipomyces kononenkoae TaxID=34357 RepID=A0ACC3T030_LIPKO